MRRTFLVEQHNAAIIEIKGYAHTAVILNAMPQWLLFVYILKHHYRVLATAIQKSIIINGDRHNSQFYFIDIFHLFCFFTASLHILHYPYLVNHMAWLTFVGQP